MTEQTKKPGIEGYKVLAYLRAKKKGATAEPGKGERMLASIARILEGCGYADVLKRQAGLSAERPPPPCLTIWRRSRRRTASSASSACATITTTPRPSFRPRPMGKDPSGLLLGGGCVDAGARQR